MVWRSFMRKENDVAGVSLYFYLFFILHKSILLIEKKIESLQIRHRKNECRKLPVK